MPERHLGLIPSVERGDLNSFFDQLGTKVLETIDVESLFKLADAPPLEIKESSLKNVKRRSSASLLLGMLPLTFIIKRISTCLKQPAPS